MRFLILFLSVFLYASVGKFKEVKGRVDVLRNDKIIHVKTDTGVDVNDTVFTGNNGKAQIVFKDHTVITLGKNSTFKIKDYLFGKKKVKARFSFLKGSFVSVTGKIGKIAPKRFKLETKNASIGIRGTIVFGQIYYGGDIVGCSSGLISVSAAGKSVLVKPGQMVGIFGPFMTNTLKAPYGYLKNIFASLSLSNSEIKSFFGKIFSSVESDRTKPAVKNITKNKQAKYVLSWKNYKTEKLYIPKESKFKALIFDNILQFENLKYK